MKYLRRHISLIFALVSMLCGFWLYDTIGKLTESYEAKLAKEYSIIAVSSDKITDDTFKRSSYLISSVEQIDAAPFFLQYSEDLSPEIYEQLKNSIPSFYRIRLYRYPSPDELTKVNAALKGLHGMLRVESFAKNQKTVSNTLEAFKNGVMVYSIIVLVFNVLLFAKFMEVWRYEHSSRMQIMAIFGAPMWMRSAVLFRMAFIDSIIAVLITIAIAYYASVAPEVAGFLASFGLVGGVSFEPEKIAMYLSGLAFGVSLFSVSTVAFRRLEH